MLDILINGLMVTLYVLGLFGLVRWVLGFFPWGNSDRSNPPQARWWFILLLIEVWLNRVSALLDQGSPPEWTKNDYLNVFYLCALTFCIVFVWTRP